MLLSGSLNSQSVAVTSAAPVQKALLEATSTTQGILLPRMTEGQKLTLSSSPPSGTPLAEGMLVYQTDGAEGYHYYDGTTWVPVSKVSHGAVEMLVGTSNTVFGTGFSVSHLSTGLDEVTFDAPQAAIPVVITSGSTIVGVPPVFPNDYCTMQLSNCNSTNISYIDINYPASGPAVFKTGNTFCNPSPGNSTSYLMSEPEWQDWPTPGAGAVSFTPGSTFRVTYQTSQFSTNSVSAWADWNHSGSYEIGELLWQEPASTNWTIPRTHNITVPASACHGTTSIRLVVRDIPNHNFACDLGDPSSAGEIETIEIVVGNSLTPASTCVYPERQTVCNLSAVNSTKFNIQCTDLQGDLTNSLYHFKIIEAF